VLTPSDEVRTSGVSRSCNAEHERDRDRDRDRYGDETLHD
jgi:hypothetical protein